MAATQHPEVALWSDQEPIAAEQIKERVHALGPLLAEEADAVNAAGQLTDRVRDALTATGLWRINFPAAWGGPQMRIDDQIELVEFIARHDASIAWNVMILVDGGTYASRTGDAAVAKEIYPSMDLPTSATTFPVGRAEQVDGGYKLSGRWSFGSGVRNAARAVCGFHRYDSDGEVELGPDGGPQLYEAWVPVEHLEIHDTWQTTGLAGTGSSDFSLVGEVTIPATHMVKALTAPDTSLPPLARYPTLIAANQLGVPLGMARHALDAFHAFVEKSRNTSTKAAKTEPTVLAAIGEAEAYYRAARAYALTTFGEVSDRIFADEDLAPAELGNMTATLTLVARLCRESLEIVMEAAGSRGVLADNAFDRIYRDMATGARHLLFRKKTFEIAGRRFLAADAVSLGELA